LVLAAPVDQVLVVGSKICVWLPVRVLSRMRPSGSVALPVSPMS
jgi:hypothetical protein